MIKEKIIDIHAHVFPDNIADKAVNSIGSFYGAHMHGAGTVADLLKSGEIAGVYKYVIHSTATKPLQVNSINTFIYNTVKENTNFIGFGTLHPSMENLEEEVSKVLDMGLKGIKLHPEFQEFKIDDREMLPVYSALEGKLPILMHMGDEVSDSSSPERLVRVMDMFPNLTIIAAHLGGYMMWDESEDLLVGRKLYFDTSSTLWKIEPERVVKIIRKHGIDRVLFGSDYPMWSHKEEIERFNQLDLNENERELILWKNAAKLLQIEK